MRKVCIVGSSKLPNPPVLGGAVPQLIQHLINENEKQSELHFECISVFDDEATKLSKQYKNTLFSYVKIDKFSSVLDSIIITVLNIIKKTNKIYSWGYLFRTISYRRGVKKILKHNNYDALIFENSIPVLLCMKSRCLQKKYNGKFYYHTHCVPRDFFNSGKLLEKANSIICVSNYIKEQTIKRFSNYNLNCEVLYNCVDTSVFHPVDEDDVIAFRNKVSLSNSDFVVGFIGRLTKDKGIVELIEAIKLIDDPNVKLLIAGSTFYNSNINDKFLSNLKDLSFSIKDRIIFTGYINNNDTPIFYCSSDIICLPSIWEEPAGITNIEAAACKRPIISTLSGGISEYIGHDRAILLDKNNKNKLILDIKEAVLSMKDNMSVCNTIANNAYNWALKNNAKQYYSDFKSILGFLD